MPDLVSNYSVAIISLLIFALIVLMQSAMVGAAKATAGVAPGSTPDADYDNKLYRLNRSHQNGTEIMPAAAIALFACILAGVPATWVNLLMAVFLATRLAYVLVYARNLGQASQGLRTFTYVAGWAMLMILCVLAIWALL